MITPTAHNDYVSTAADPMSPARGRSLLERHGYVCLRGLIDPDAVVQQRERLYEIAAGHGWGERSGDRLVADPQFLATVGPGSYYPVFHQMWAHEELHALAHRPRVLQMLAALLGLGVEQVLVHPQQVLRWQWPQDPGSTPGPHQDHPELQGSLRQLTVWIPLHAVGRHDGALPVYPFTHLDGVRDLELADNPSGWQATVHEDETAHVGAMEPGDVLVFSTTTIHGGSRNTSETFRVSIDVRFQPLADQLCVSALDLPGYPYDWSETCAGWSRRLNRYWERLPLNIVPHDDRWERWRDRESVRVGELGDVRALPALRITATDSPDREVRSRASELLARLAPADHSDA